MDLHLGEDAWHGHSRWRLLRVTVVTLLAWLVSSFVAGLGNTVLLNNVAFFFTTVSYYVPAFMVRMRVRLRVRVRSRVSEAKVYANPNLNVFRMTFVLLSERPHPALHPISLRTSPHPASPIKPRPTGCTSIRYVSSRRS